MKEIIFSHNFILKEKLAQYIIGLILIISGEILHSCMVTYMPAFAYSILTDNGEFSAIVIYILISNIIIIIANRIEKKANKIVNNNRIIRSKNTIKLFVKQIMKILIDISLKLNMKQVKSPFMTVSIVAFTT